MAGTVTIRILGDVAGLQRALGQASGGLDRLSSSMRRVGSTMTTYVTAPIVAGFGLAVKAAADESQEMAVLANTLRNTVGATEDQIDATERWITATQNATGVADGELRPALGKLLISGRSVEQAQKDLAVAMDIAAARGLSLETVTTAMSKAAMGQVTGLQRLGIATKDAAGETLTYDQILQKASETMGGAAATAADTAAGRAAIVRAKMADLSETIGTALIPILDKLTSFISKVTSWFSNLSSGMQTTVIAVVGVIAALGPLIAAVGSVITIVQGLGAALTFLAANPVVLIIAAVAALAAALVYAYNTSETFQHVVETVFDAVRTAAEFLAEKVSAAFSWIKAHIDLVLVAGLGPLGAAIVILKNNWETIWNAMSAAVKTAWDIMRPIIDTIRAAVEGISGLVDRVFNGNILNEEQREQVRRRKRAHGGPLARNQPAIVGENGPELFTPSTSGMVTSTRHLAAPSLDPEDFGRRAARAMSRELLLILRAS